VKLLSPIVRWVIATYPVVGLLDALDKNALVEKSYCRNVPSLMTLKMRRRIVPEVTCAPEEFLSEAAQTRALAPPKSEARTSIPLNPVEVGMGGS
jgi:hypothetical protein